MLLHWRAAVMKPTLLLLLGLALASPGFHPARAADTPPTGLSAQGDTLLLQGRPFRGVGVNYFDLFSRRLRQPPDDTSLAGLRELGQAKVPFVRFMACGFWPVDNALYRTNPAIWFKTMDEVVQTAEASGVGLIPSLFWHLSTVVDLMGEPVGQLGNPQSRSRTFIRQYTKEMVTRYRNSPAIWGWELGNEYNLAADLPNAAQHRPPLWPKLGTATYRTELDDFTSAMMTSLLADFAAVVRQHDPHRIIVSGNAIPRSTAWHNTREHSWKQDTLEQYAEVLLRDNPAPLDTLCIHLYPERKGNYPAAAGTLADVIARTQKIARQARRPLFIGEFGVGASTPTDTATRHLDEMLGGTSFAFTMASESGIISRARFLRLCSNNCGGMGLWRMIKCKC